MSGLNVKDVSQNQELKSAPGKAAPLTLAINAEIIKDCKARKRDYKYDMNVIPVNFFMMHQQMNAW
jgi:hypothetical protein